MYKTLAPYYDYLGWAEFTDRIWPLLNDFFRMIGSPPLRFLDIACGTGVLTSLLADIGVKVTGIDICQEMIRVAEAKSYEVEPVFHVANMCDFTLEDSFPVTACFYDALNHLSTEEQLASAFRCAAKHTETDGYYVFDLLTENGLRMWEPYFSQKADEYMVSQRGFFDAENGAITIKVEAFVRSDSGEVTFIDERLHERAFNMDFVKQSLAEAGFTKFSFRPFSPDESLETAGRLFAVCKK